MNEQQNVDALLARLKRVEAQGRRLRLTLAGVVVTLALAGCFALGMGTAVGEARPGPVVRAERFELVAGDGKLRGWLGMTKEGPQMVLYDDKGKGRAGLAVPEAGPGLELYDKTGKVIWSAP